MSLKNSQISSQLAQLLAAIKREQGVREDIDLETVGTSLANVYLMLVFPQILLRQLRITFTQLRFSNSLAVTAKSFMEAVSLIMLSLFPHIPSHVPTALLLFSKRQN